MNSFKTILQLKHWLFIALFLASATSFAQSKQWVGTWSCAPYAVGNNNTPSSPYLQNNTLRQVVRVSIGGDTIRLKFSNKTGTTPVTMNAVSIAVSTGGSSIDANTIQMLKFNGNSAITIPSYGSAVSDPLAFNLPADTKIAITIYYGDIVTNTGMTGHVGSRTDSYIMTGNQTQAATFDNPVITSHWYTINTIDVKTASTAGCVGILGNSITDGYGLSGGLQNRWTDAFSKKLLSNPETSDVGVLNLGIGGTNVSGNGATTGLSRFQKDILDQSGIRWIIIFYGVNDIGGNASASTVTNAYQKMINDAHARNIKVYGATITPFNGSSYYSVSHEAVRKEVNAWIKTPGNFDGWIDFDQTIVDPANPDKMLPIYSNDWLHPNALGYQTLGESVNTALFTEITENNALIANAGADQEVLTESNSTSGLATLDASGCFDFTESIQRYLWKLNGDSIANGVRPTVSLPIGVHTISLTIVNQNGLSDEDEVIITVKESSGIWLEAEAGTVGSLWNIETDLSASNQAFVTVKPGNVSSGSAPATATGHLTFPFTVKSAGNYRIWFRVICPSADDDSFWLKMDNGNFVMWNGVASYTNAWTWVSHPDNWNLTTGDHVFTVGYREDGAKLDKIVIINDGSTPTGTGPTASNVTALPSNLISGLSIYPNPVANVLNVNQLSSSGTLEVFDTFGNKVMEKNTTLQTESLDCSHLNAGVYFLKISNNQQTTVKPFVKKAN